MQSIIKQLGSNRKSALAVTMINIPLCISLAIASGATPLMGLLTGVWSSIFAAIFCSSKHNIYGPAGSLAGILLPVALTYGIQYIPILAIGGGLIIILFAALRLSKYITLIPGSALQGFLLGIGLIIGLQQVPGALGLNLDYGVTEAIMNIAQTNRIALAVFAGSMVVLQLFKRFVPAVPGAVVVTVVGILIGKFVIGEGNSSLDLLLDRFADVTFSLMQLFDYTALMNIFSDMVLLKTLVVASIGVGVIAILETLISAKIATKDTRVPYDSQREIYGLGITNILSGIFGGLPASALVVRTGMNIENGATSKLSGGLVGVITAVLALFFFQGWLQYIPFAVIAAILIDVSLGMINLSLYHKMWKLEKVSILIILLVGVISYLFDPMLGILVGAVMALLALVNRSMDADLIANVFRGGHHAEKLPLGEYDAIQEEGDLIIIKLEGELNYLTTEAHITAMRTITKANQIVLGFGHTASVDIDAQEEFTHIIKDRMEAGKKVYLTGLHGQTLHMMEQSVVYNYLQTKGYVYESKSELLEDIL